MAVNRIEAARHNSPLNNPCLRETELTRKCLDENDYKYEKCDLQFENFRQCKKFWNNVRRHRRAQGLPELPPPEEREKIKAEFLKKRFG